MPLRGFAGISTSEHAWLGTESPLGQWLLLLSYPRCLCCLPATTVVSVVLRLNPGGHSSCLCCVSVAGTFLCGHCGTPSIAAGVLGVPVSWEAALDDSDVDVSSWDLTFIPAKLDTQSSESTGLAPHSSQSQRPRTITGTVHIALPPPRLGKHLVLEEAEPGAHSQSPFFEPSTPPNSCTWGPL